MNSENLIVSGIMLLLFAFFLILGIVLRSGKGAWMIAGYNTSSKAEKAKYDEKALCRFVARLMFFCAFCMFLAALAPVVGSWIIFPSQGLLFIGIIGGVIYANTGNRFKKK